MQSYLDHVVFTNELQKYKVAAFVLYVTFYYTERTSKGVISRDKCFCHTYQLKIELLIEWLEIQVSITNSCCF